MVLSLIDPDGERHMYVFDEAGRQRLLELLTGGVAVAPAPRLVRPNGRPL